MMSPAVSLIEMAPRDGLQSLGRLIPLESKIAFVEALSETGVSEIEVGSFVSPKAIPAMADSALVFQKIRRNPKVIYSALVPNEKGFDEALKARADKISVFTAASETFNKKNINATIAESLERFKPVIKKAEAESLPTRAYVSTAFFCPYEGRVSPQTVLPVCEKLLDSGVDEISIGDTVGRAAPNDVRALLDFLLKKISSQKIALHFHDTYGMAVANALAAYQDYGILIFDASSGGIGGCPYAPGASGNVALEDLAFAFEASGAKTGVDLQKIKTALARIKPHLGIPISSRLNSIASPLEGTS